MSTQRNRQSVVAEIRHTAHRHRRREIRASSRAHRILCLEALEDRTVLSTFTVTNVLDGGLGSLRQAILDANANPGADVIAFNIPGGGVQTIQPTSALPTITGPVTIDGYTQRLSEKFAEEKRS